MAFQIEDGVLIQYIENSVVSAITVPDGVTEIGMYAFQWCGLSKIMLPEDVQVIGEGAFAGSLLLEEITLPETLTFIPEHAFQLCATLKYIRIPEQVTQIGAGAFENCLSLTEIRLPEKITAIAPKTFESCMKLHRIMIPEGVTEIGEQAFKECAALMEVRIPDSVTAIAEDAFCGCPADIILQLEGESLYFPHVREQRKTDTQYILDFICAKDLKQREQIFQQMEQLRHKAPIVLYLLDRGRKETVGTYLRSRISHLVNFWIQQNDDVSISRFLEYGYVTKKHIDNLISYAISCSALQCQTILLHYKDQLGFTAPENYFRL